MSRKLNTTVRYVWSEDPYFDALLYHEDKVVRMYVDDPESTPEQQAVDRKAAEKWVKKYADAGYTVLWDPED